MTNTHITNAVSPPKERPILFGADMVLAILNGKKTQTRRIVKPRPDWCEQLHFDELLAVCPYGRIGDLLWVRETFVLENTRDYHYDGEHIDDGRPVQKLNNDGQEYWLIPHYRATEPEPHIVTYNQCEDDDITRWKSPIYMPRWASRILLEITSIRIERLNDISENDAESEGVGFDYEEAEFNVNGKFRSSLSATNSYQKLFESINGIGSWANNPWVWVVDFANN